MIGRMTTVAALILASILGGHGGECAADRQGPRLAQYSSSPNVPGGLPGRAVAPQVPLLSAPAPTPDLSVPSLSPTLRAPEAAPSVAATPPPPPAARAPEAHGTEGCDCHAEVDVPVYANGQIVAWRREWQLTGRSPQCCPK
jgi:hypothetical protein